MDLNGDGHRDILSGSYSRTGSKEGMAGLFQVLYGQQDGGFKQATVLNGTDDKPLIIPVEGRSQMTLNICTRPTAVDWDSDGDLDLVVGNFAGSFYRFTGEGKGKFNPVPTQIMAGKEPLKIQGVHSDPFLVDWDKDGDIDLLSGSSNGGVQFSENVAGKGKPPELKAFVTLIDPGTPVGYGTPVSEEELTGPTQGTRIWIEDVNSDNKLDLLIGDNVTLVTRAEGLSEEEFKEKLAEWQKKLAELANSLRDTKASPDERRVARQKYSELSRSKSKFMKEERTGFVWLFVQK